MKTEELQALGLNEEQVREVFKLNGQDISHVRSQMEDKIKEVEESKLTLEDQIKELSEKTGDEINLEEYNTIKEAKEDLEKQLADISDEHNNQLQSLKFQNALDMELYKSKAKSTKAVQALIDKDSIKWEDGELKGLNEAIETIKSEHGYLFDSEQTGGPRYTRGTDSSGDGEKVSAFEAAASKILRI